MVAPPRAQSLVCLGWIHMGFCLCTFAYAMALSGISLPFLSLVHFPCLLRLHSKVVYFVKFLSSFSHSLPPQLPPREKLLPPSAVIPSSFYMKYVQKASHASWLVFFF